MRIDLVLSSLDGAVCITKSVHIKGFLVRTNFQDVLNPERSLYEFKRNIENNRSFDCWCLICRILNMT